MKKKICLIISLVILIMTVASIASARDNICSYCNARMRLYDKSDEFLVRRYTATCNKYSNRRDTMEVWGVDYFYQCSNPSCGIEAFYDTKTRTERICDH